MSVAWSGHWKSLAKITPRSWSTADTGEVTPVDGTAVENIPCTFQGLSANESMQLGREFGTHAYWFLYPARMADGTAITLRHDAKVEATAGPMRGQAFKVMSGSVDVDGTGRVMRAMLEVET